MTSGWRYYLVRQNDFSRNKKGSLLTARLGSRPTWHLRSINRHCGFQLAPGAVRVFTAQPAILRIQQASQWRRVRWPERLAAAPDERMRGMTGLLAAAAPAPASRYKAARGQNTPLQACVRMAAAAESAIAIRPGSPAAVRLASTSGKGRHFLKADNNAPLVRSRNCQPE